MRFMVIVKSNADSEAGKMPAPEDLAAMGRFNEELIDAGIMLAGEGLRASSLGAKLKFETKGKATVVDGPFAEAKELVGGFWIIQAKDRDEAVARMRRAPMAPGAELEIRQLAEVSDFPADPVSDEHLRKEQEWRDANQKPISN
ncbi:MAG: YciI family protein [Devosia sp.]